MNVTNNHQPCVETFDTCFSLFEVHIHPISKFKVARHKFYLMKQESNEVIDQYVLKLCDCLRECHFPEAVHNEMLLDRIISGTIPDDLVRKFLSKGKELTLTLAVEMIRSHEARDQSHREIQRQMTKPSSKVDAATTKMSKPKLKGKCCGCDGDHACGKDECQTKSSECHKSSNKWPLC